MANCKAEGATFSAGYPLHGLLVTYPVGCVWLILRKTTKFPSKRLSLGANLIVATKISPDVAHHVGVVTINKVTAPTSGPELGSVRGRNMQLTL